MPVVVLCLPGLVLATLGLTSGAPEAAAEPLAGEIVVAAAGDIASCSHDNDEATAQVLDAIAPDRVLTLGDNAYSSGTDAQFAGCYHPTWGRHLAKTHPSPGNHDYQTGGATGYFNYFGAAAGDPTKGYYAFDVGVWRFYALNSNCPAVSCAAGSPQEQWLRADLAQNPRTCTAAFMHHPRYASGDANVRRNNQSMAPLFQAFYDLSGDLWLTGHNHQYERLTRLNPAGAIDLQRGVRIFVVGTGGAGLYAFGPPNTGSEVRMAVYGVLKLTLRDGGYDWEFVPVAGSGDTGTDTCGAAPAPGNAAPAVDAGPDQTIAASGEATLDGTVTDDGLPNPPATVTTVWSQKSGPGTVSFGDASAVDTTATFSVDGSYVLRLTASDSDKSAFDELTVDVGSVPNNQPPTVSAGSDQTVTLPSGATLDGNVDDDGLPSPPGTVTTTWSRQSGPAAVTFGNASQVDTTATFSQSGTYVLRLTASDGALSDFDEVTVTVTGGSAPSSELYFSLRAVGTVGGVKVANEDIVFFDGSTSLVFDGSDVGLASLRIDAFSWIDADTLLLSFDAPGSVGDAGAVDDSDVVRFDATSLGTSTAGTFSLYFDGGDVGLTTDAEDVDAVELLSGGRVLISSTGALSVTGLSAADEDLVSFTPTSLGNVTAGSFAPYFDGSDVDLSASSEDVDAAAVDGSGNILLSTTDAFAVPAVSGQDEDVFVFVPTSTGSTTSGGYASTLYFDGSSVNLAGNDVFAIDLP